jgi:hypothetical protein
MEILFLLLSVLSIAVMLYALYNVFVLRHKIPGGKIKATWNFLSGLIVLFSAAYLSTPFFRLLPAEIKDVFVGVIFLAGAVFVLIVIRMFLRVIEDIGL